MIAALIEIAYLVAAALFIVGLKRMNAPATARQGNQVSAVGMLIAIVATLLLGEILTPVQILIGLVVGTGIGWWMAAKIKMTSMPELVGAFNGSGGLASMLVAGAEIARELGYLGGERVVTQVALQGAPAAAVFDVSHMVVVGLSIFIGAVTFSGSIAAVGKLAGWISGNPVSFPGMRVLTVLVTAGSVAALGVMVAATDGFPAEADPVVWGAIVLSVLALVLGVLVVIPIGGADMPVVISLMNSYSGLAAAATGFVLDNTALIVSGALVGASGIILTKIMCEAMNRSLVNVLLGGFGGEATGEGSTATASGLTVRDATPDDVAVMLAYAENVIVVPGYGLAVSQAQHQVHALSDLLQKRGVNVRYAVHPVAGRMPGHMNVLLAEANVPYEQLYEMDAINDDFDSTDVALVIGANDVVNPAARHDKASPIYGMPILNVDHAKTVVVMKRSMRPGYAGVENELFYLGNTRMLFGDAKDSLIKLANEIKAL